MFKNNEENIKMLRCDDVTDFEIWYLQMSFFMCVKSMQRIKLINFKKLTYQRKWMAKENNN